jgi:hypothetical protein
MFGFDLNFLAFYFGQFYPYSILCKLEKQEGVNKKV